MFSVPWARLRFRWACCLCRLIFCLCSACVACFERHPSVQQTPLHSGGLQGETVTVCYSIISESDGIGHISPVMWQPMNRSVHEMSMIVHAFYWDSRCFLWFSWVPRLWGILFCPICRSLVQRPQLHLMVCLSWSSVCMISANDGFFQDLFLEGQRQSLKKHGKSAMTCDDTQEESQSPLGACFGCLVVVWQRYRYLVPRWHHHAVPDYVQGSSVGSADEHW